MNTRLYNAHILNMKGDPIYQGEVWIEDDLIVYAGDGKDLSSYYAKHEKEILIWDKEIDCRGNLLIPGFKDAHTHSGMTVLRSHADDLPLSDWLNNQIFPYEAKLTPEDIYTLTKLAILEYLSGGITGVMEMYLTPETIAKAANDMGMRMVQVGGVNNFSESIDLMKGWMKTLNGTSKLTSFQLGFHAEYTCSKELLEELSAYAHEIKAPVFTHISETAAEVEGCIERYGKTPVAFLADLGLFDFGGAGYHLVHTTPEDIEILKEKKISVVTNPGSNTKLASGIAPISEYLKAGVPVAIGTDGPASNNCLDMFREMFLTCGLAKLRTNDASAVPAMEVLKMATVTGAHVMQLPDCDAIAEGKIADLVLIDLQEPNMQPIHQMANNLVYSGSKSNIMMTMIGGIVRFDRFDGRSNYHVGDSIEQIYEDCAKISERIFA